MLNFKPQIDNINFGQTTGGEVVICLTFYHTCNMILEVKLVDWIKQEAFPSGFQNRFEKNKSSSAECNMSTNSQGQLLELSTKKVLPWILCSRFKPTIKQKNPKN